MGLWIHLHQTPLPLHQSLPVAWGTAALSFRPAVVPPRPLFGFSLASSSVAAELDHHVLPNVSLAFFFCAYLYKRKKAFISSIFFLKFVYISTWQVPGTAAAPRFLLLAQALVYLLDASGNPNPDSTTLGVVQPRLGKTGPVRKSCN